METIIVASFTFMLGAIIGSIVESRHNKKKSMEAWKKERMSYLEDRYK